MLDTQRLKQVRQDVADTNAKIAALRNEGRTLQAYADEKLKGGMVAVKQNARLAAIVKELDQETASVATLTRELADLERESDDAKRQSTMNGDQSSRILKPSGRRFAEMFPQAGAAMNDWESPSQFLTAIAMNLYDDRLQAAMTTGTGTDGGYAVPPGMLASWLDTSLESEIVRSRAQVWPMTSDTRVVPAWDIMNRSGDDIAGFEIQWVAEGVTSNLQVGKVRKLKLVAKKGVILTQGSEELRADGVDFDQQLNQILAQSFGYGMDRVCLVGTGQGQPLGVLNSPARITVLKENGQTADTINYTNLTKMFARLTPASIERAVWVAHPSTIPQLSALTVTVGDGGSHIPVMTQGKGGFVILTIPVIFSEKVEPLGNEGDIGLYDFSQYAIGMRQEVTIDTSAHVGFREDVMTWRLKLRMDGQPVISEPYTLPNGAPTMSPFVVLQERA